MGRILGNAIATSYDSAVTKTFAGLTEQELAGTGTALDIDAIFTAIATIRGAGETGQLTGIVSTDSYAALMSDIGTAAYAGGEFQNGAMRTGFFGHIAGVNCFVSSYLNNTVIGSAINPKMVILSQDAVKAATQGGVNLEIARRPEAVGYDIVASLAHGSVVTDATRGVIIIDQS